MRIVGTVPRTVNELASIAVTAEPINRLFAPAEMVRAPSLVAVPIFPLKVISPEVLSVSAWMPAMVPSIVAGKEIAAVVLMIELAVKVAGEAVVIVNEVAVMSPPILTALAVVFALATLRLLRGVLCPMELPKVTAAFDPAASVRDCIPEVRPLIVPPKAIAPEVFVLVVIVTEPSRTVGTLPPTVNEFALNIPADAPNVKLPAPAETVKSPIALGLPTSPSIAIAPVVVKVRALPAPWMESAAVLVNVMGLDPVLIKTGAVNVTGIVDWVAKEVFRYRFPPKLNASPEVKTSPIGMLTVPMVLPKVMPLDAPASTVRAFPPEEVTAPVIVIAAEPPPPVVLRSTFVPSAVGPVITIVAPLVVMLAPFRLIAFGDV